MRTGSDEVARDGTILNGYDYNLQVWVEKGICLSVGSGKEHAGRRVSEVEGHEVRE